jgi:hypothetical protein
MSQVKRLAACRREVSDEEEHVRNMYNIALDLEDGDNLCIDLPPSLGNGVDRSPPRYVYWNNYEKNSRKNVRK